MILTCIRSDKVVQLVGIGSVINGQGYPVEYLLLVPIGNTYSHLTQTTQSIAIFA